MKQNLIYIFILIALTSFQADISGPWVETGNEQIILFSRPENYSKTNSPDPKTLQIILDEQKQVIDLINQRLNTNFDSKIEIYLFNFDEAEEKIGTNGGGYCSTRKPRIYFTFSDKPIFNTIRNNFEYVGTHEMVHLITRDELGKPKTAFFGEGYANAIDGNYGLKKEGENFIRRRNDSTIQRIKENGTLLTPSELLHNNNISERVYYPQIGCLINFLFDKYGVEKINKLYTVSQNQIETKFHKVTGETFKEMEKKYLKYIEEQ